MKKAIKTLFQPHSLKVTLMVVFAWCCLSLPTAFAQDIIMTDDGETTNTSNSATLDCETDSEPRLFTDDGLLPGNYADADGSPRSDTVEICPRNGDFHVKVTFHDMDIAAGDTLYAFNGNIDSVRANAAVHGIGSGSGVGASNFRTNAGGTGWITSSCDPLSNPSGCITFIFATNGDNRKGAGWNAWVECQERDGARLGDVTIADARLTCTEFAGLVTIPAPPVIVCSDTLVGANGFVIAKIRNAKGEVCIEQRMAANSTFDISLGVGQYTVTYCWESGETVTLTKLISVSEPSLVCNDEVTAPLGAACAVQFTPDDLLENPCDTIQDVMYYNITITLGSGKDAQVLETENFDNANAVIYPTITKEAIAAAGVDICGGTATVKVERIYYGRGVPAAISCDNGVVTAFCETTVVLQDLSNPVINIPAGDITIVACDANGIESLIGATATDNCDDVTVETESVIIDADDDAPCFGDNDTTIAIVNLIATDQCGNIGRASKTVTIIRPFEVAKVDDVTASCNDDAAVPVPGLKIGRIVDGDFVVTDTVPLNAIEDGETSTELSEYVCGYILIYRDEPIPNTDCGSKLYRYYDIVDWCNSSIGPSTVDTVYLEYSDQTPPSFTDANGGDALPATDIPLGANVCTYDINQFSDPNAEDDCSGASVRLNTVSRIEDGQPWPIDNQADWANLDCDSFLLEWIAEDGCHEQLINDTVTQIVVIKDVTPPTAIAVDQLNVSVPNNEGALVLVDAIDAGSNDACNIVSREIRRENPDGTFSEWGPSVVIECEDVHEEVKVELRVIDKQGNIALASGAGTNVSWSIVKAEDKIPPICTPLENDTLTCKDIHTGELGASTDDNNDGMYDDDSEWESLTGDLLTTYETRFGRVEDNACVDNLDCGDLTFEQEYQLIELDCGELIAKRRYRAFDWQGDGGNPSGWAVQHIVVNYVPEWTLVFPADIDLTCADRGNVPAPATAEDVIINGSCDLWALELVREDTFEVGNNVCMKIERRYEVTNWCQYNAGETATPVRNTPLGDTIRHTDANVQSRYVYTQVIKLYATEAPIVTINTVDTCILGLGDAEPFNEEDQNLGAAPYECDEERIFSASAINCVNAQLSDFTWKIYLDGVLGGEGTGADFAWIVQPDIEHKVEFWASDGCGNSAGKDTTFIFRDCKKPTPYVLNGIAVDLGENGTVQVWANDLDQGSFDNCTDQEDLDMYITTGELTDIVSTVAEIEELGMNVTLDCDNVGRTNVLIYVVDARGNWDVVGTYINVSGNATNCNGTADPTGMVAGHIVNLNGENVEQAVVSVSGAMQESMMTNADGTFQFELNAGDDYTVTPVKDMNPLNGVSTFDLVLISKHILGITTFDSPYKYVAADINKSGTITAFDMVQLRQLILNIKTEFSNNDSWRFVDASHEFTSANPLSEEFNEFYTINTLNQDMMNLDFVGVKVGDVNGNAAANSLLGAESRTTNGSLTFNVTDRFVEAGESVTVDFTSTNIADAQGYQFTMNFAGLTFDNLVEGTAKAANFNTNLAERGVIATSWNGEATANDALFSLTFNATTSGLLSELMTVSSDLTAAEAYNTAGELLDVSIEFSTVVEASGFELGQNIPNPFNGETVIGFNLPKAGSATLTVMNVQGKVLKEIKGDYAKGYNTVVLKASDLATGVLHYQLESADQVATKKMIIIE